MPTMSQGQVGILPMYSRTAMTLDELRDVMISHPPESATMTGGWASMDNSQSNLGIAGGVPPASDPELQPGADGSPEMLSARYYYWERPPAGLQQQQGFSPQAYRRLAAIDVSITKVGTDHIGILFSTRSRQLLQQKAGVVASLERLLQTADTTIKIDRSKSHLALESADIFLWLTVQKRDKPQIAGDLRLDLVSGISGRDASSRTADLRAGVDFDRPNFLTAVAGADTLGPIDISFVQSVGTSQRSFRVKLYVDGGFEISKNDIAFPVIMDTEERMLTASLLLANSLIPKINGLFKADAARWAVRRNEVIESAMVELETIYRKARAALKVRLKSAPKAP